MRQMGLVPRDILNTGPLTASQYSDDHFLTRVEVKSHALKVSSEERMREKLNQVARHYARTGSGESGPAEEKEVGDLTDFWRTPTEKGLVAWRGPATIVNTTEKNHGRYGIVWGGKYFTVPSD